MTLVDDYDNPWKQAIDAYFQEFMSFYFPVVAQAVDWASGYESLDSELPSLVRDGELGNRYADKLVRVTTLLGDQKLLYIHVEVQGQRDQNFARRMYVYHYRIFDRYDAQPVSLAVLADEQVNWKPEGFTYNHFGCGVDFKFPVVKLLDYEQDQHALLASDNPFALLTVAHLQTRQTKDKTEERFATKMMLVKLLYQKGWQKQEVIDLFAVMDWMMYLPPAIAEQFNRQLAEYEQEKKMRYVTSIERMGFENGMQQGIQQGIQDRKSVV